MRRTKKSTKASGKLFDRSVVNDVPVFKKAHALVQASPKYALFSGSCSDLLSALPEGGAFDLIVTSPPYNIGKPYEQTVELNHYRAQQTAVIQQLVKRLKPNGSLCWQVGNHIVSSSNNRGSVYPLDYLFHPIFDSLGLVLRNRIVWRFGHGLHCKHRFSGRYEVILWYTKANEYYFDLDSVRVKPKYPGKRHYKGPNAGKLSSNPLGKNPEDIWEENCDSLWEGFWDIPNVKSNHIEKQAHPCQFPVGLVERLIKALCPVDGLVFDPFCGAASSGVAAAITKRRFWGAEILPEYVEISKTRMLEALNGNAKYRPHDKPIYDHKKSPLSKIPAEAASLFRFQND